MSRHRNPSPPSSEQYPEEGFITRIIARSAVGVGIFSMTMFCLALIWPDHKPGQAVNFLILLYVWSWPISIILSILTLIFVHRDRRLRRSALNWSFLAIVSFVIIAIVYYFRGSMLAVF